MLTVSEREEDVAASLKAGARGYILKGVTARDLVKAVQSVHMGESYVTPTLAASLLFDWRQGQGSMNAPASPLEAPSIVIVYFARCVVLISFPSIFK